MKVGKAIYNILSQSTDVQSNFPFNTTDYSPTGTELVTNGDFSATGADLITNGDFSATGSELATFSLGNISFGNLDGSISTSLGGIDYRSVAIGDTNDSRPRVQFNNLTEGKSYKIVYTPSSTTGASDFDLFQNTVRIVVNHDISLPLTTYLIAGAGYNGIDFNGTNTFTTDYTLSIKELGEDWDDSGTPLKAATFDANGLTITSVNGDGNNNRVSQANVTEAAKSYKVTYTIHSATLSGSNVFQYYNGATYVTFSEQGVGTHTFYYTREDVENGWYFRVATYDGSTTDYVTISSIVVQELGEGWGMNETGSVAYNENGATITSINGGADEYKLYQDDVTTSGKSYKVVYTIYANGITGTNRLRYYDGASYVIADSSVGTHTFYFTRVPPTDRWYWNLTTYAGTPTTDFVTISSISVEEMVLNKIFPELAPPDIDAPYVVYSVVSNSPSETKNANGDIDTASIEVYGFQDTYNKAVDLGVSIRAALDRKTGTYNTIEIQSTNYVNEQMDVNEARKLWAAIQDYSIRIKNIS